MPKPQRIDSALACSSREEGLRGLELTALANRDYASYRKLETQASATYDQEKARALFLQIAQTGSIGRTYIDYKMKEMLKSSFFFIMKLILKSSDQELSVSIKTCAIYAISFSELIINFRFQKHLKNLTKFPKYIISNF